MREEIVNWVKICVNSLVRDFQENEDAQLLVKVFITQYELNTIKSVKSNKSIKYNNQLNYAQQKIKNKIIKQQKQSISFFPNPKQIDVLFWPFQKMHLDAQIDIYRSLTANGELKVGIFSNNKPIADKIIQEKLEDSISMNFSKPNWVDYKSLYFYKDLMLRVEKLPTLEINHITIYFKEILIKSLNVWYWLYVQTVDVFEKIHKKFNPKSIFVGNSITLVGNIIGHLAVKKNIKVFCMMHGRMNDYATYCKFDYFYLFGEKDKKNLIKNGIDTSKLIVSGSPKIDIFLKTEKFKLNNNNRTILVALSGSGHSITEQHHIKILEALYKVALKLINIEFKFKLHKKDKFDYYKKLNSLSNVSIFGYENKSVSSNIYDWILEADMLITGASTTALDAMLMKCPVITIDLLGHLKNVEFIKQNVSLHSTNVNELLYNINVILENEKTLKNHLITIERFIKGYYTQPKEGSSSLIEKHIKSLF